MEKGLIALIIVALVVILGVFGFLYYSQLSQSNYSANSNSEKTELNNAQSGLITDTKEKSQINTIEITSSGFSPSKLEINKGESVIWINKGDLVNWPASAMHPTHTVYPGSDISKCGTIEENKIFDACKGIAKGENWSFTFNEKGTWGYHDHLNPSLRGQIIVK